MGMWKYASINPERETPLSTLPDDGPECLHAEVWHIKTVIDALEVQNGKEGSILLGHNKVDGIVPGAMFGWWDWANHAQLEQ